jgi:hypothetical protein
MNEIEPDDTVLGAVGGMMYGPEAESGSLAQDAPTSTTGGAKEKIQEEVEEKVEYIKKTVFPLLGA